MPTLRDNSWTLGGPMKAIHSLGHLFTTDIVRLLLERPVLLWSIFYCVASTAILIGVLLFLRGSLARNSVLRGPTNVSYLGSEDLSARYHSCGTERDSLDISSCKPTSEAIRIRCICGNTFGTQQVWIIREKMVGVVCFDKPVMIYIHNGIMYCIACDSPLGYRPERDGICGS